MTVELRDPAGREIVGWTRVAVTAALTDAARSVSASFSPAIADVDALDVRAGDALEVWHVDDDLPDAVALTGSVVGFDLSRTADSLGVTMVGQSSTCDVVDSDAKLETLRRPTLRRLGEVLLEPFGVELAALVDDPEPLASVVRPEVGEKIVEMIQRYAEPRGIRVTDDEVGRLVLWTLAAATVSSTPLRYGAGPGEGRATLAADSALSLTERYSEILCYGQIVTPDRAIVDAVGRARDYGITRRRRRVIVPDHGMAPGDAERLAIFEAQRAIARSQSVVLRVAGWRQDDGTIWRPGELVDVYEPALKLEARMVAARVTLEATTTDGEHAEIEVAPVEAYLSPPEFKARGRGAGRGLSYWLRRSEDGRIVYAGGGTAVAAPATNTDDPGAFDDE